MKSTLTIEFDSQESLLSFLQFFVKHNTPVQTFERTSQSAQQKKTNILVTKPEKENLPDEPDQPRLAICANPKCGKQFIPVKNGITCSKGCSVQATYYKKKAERQKQKNPAME